MPPRAATQSSKTPSHGTGKRKSQRKLQAVRKKQLKEQHKVNGHDLGHLHPKLA